MSFLKKIVKFISNEIKENFDFSNSNNVERMENKSSPIDHPLELSKPACRSTKAFLNYIQELKEDGEDGKLEEVFSSISMSNLISGKNISFLLFLLQDPRYMREPDEQSFDRTYEYFKSTWTINTGNGDEPILTKKQFSLLMSCIELEKDANGVDYMDNDGTELIKINGKYYKKEYLIKFYPRDPSNPEKIQNTTNLNDLKKMDFYMIDKETNEIIETPMAVKFDSEGTPLLHVAEVYSDGTQLFYPVALDKTQDPRVPLVIEVEDESKLVSGKVIKTRHKSNSDLRTIYEIKQDDGTIKLAVKVFKKDPKDSEEDLFKKKEDGEYMYEYLTDEEINNTIKLGKFRTYQDGDPDEKLQTHITAFDTDDGMDFRLDRLHYLFTSKLSDFDYFYKINAFNNREKIKSYFFDNTSVKLVLDTLKENLSSDSFKDMVVVEMKGSELSNYINDAEKASKDTDPLEIDEDGNTVIERIPYILPPFIRKMRRLSNLFMEDASLKELLGELNEDDLNIFKAKCVEMDLLNTRWYGRDYPELFIENPFLKVMNQDMFDEENPLSVGLIYFLIMLHNIDIEPNAPRALRSRGFYSDVDLKLVHDSIIENCKENGGDSKCTNEHLSGMAEKCLDEGIGPSYCYGLTGDVEYSKNLDADFGALTLFHTSAPSDCKPNPAVISKENETPLEKNAFLK